MMRIAEALAAFKPHRGDAIVVPGRGGKFWVDLTTNEKLSAGWCCSIPRAIY